MLNNINAVVGGMLCKSDKPSIIIIIININFPDRAAGKEQCASACTLRVVTMEAVSWLECLVLTRTLRVVAVVVARLSDARGCCGSARTMRAQREVQLALRNNYHISHAP